MQFFHGTTESNARSLLDGAALSAARAAANKTDGPAGFFLATVRSDAEFFAVRSGAGVVIVVEIEEAALSALRRAGAVRRPLHVTARSPLFAGDELYVPVDVFAVFNRLRMEGGIDVSS